MTCRLTFSSLSWSPLQSVFKETLKVFQTGLRLFMTVYDVENTKQITVSFLYRCYEAVSNTSDIMYVSAGA